MFKIYEVEFPDALGNELDDFSNSTIANFIIHPEGPSESTAVFDFAPHFDQSSYEFMIPEGMNNVETIFIIKFNFSNSRKNQKLQLSDSMGYLQNPVPNSPLLAMTTIGSK